jgi:zinc finger protein CreA/MIG
MHTQTESYARPTVVGSYRDSHRARRSLPSRPANSTDVALDEVHHIDQQEAIRRAEYEARRAEALWRAEIEVHRAADIVTPHPKSALPRFMSAPFRCDGSGHEPEPANESSKSYRYHVSAEDALKRSGKMPRKTGDPALQMTPMSRVSSRRSEPSNHLVDAMHSHAPLAREHSHAPWAHPCQHIAHPTRVRSLSREQQIKISGECEDTPSPMTSDSESFPRSASHSPSDALQVRSHFLDPRFAAAPSEPALQSHPGARVSEAIYTPLTSPVLGPLRTLKLHSAAPSRVPSPILLPPPSIAASAEFSGLEDALPLYGSRSARAGTFGSPPNSDVFNRVKAKRKSPGSDDPLPPSTFLSRPFHYHHHHHSSYLSERSLTPLPTPSLPTPQLSSGPSSPGSSPRSLSQSSGPPPPAGPLHPFAPRGGGGSGNGTVSVASSRAPSPSPWPPPPPLQPGAIIPRHRRVGSSSGGGGGGNVHAHAHAHHHHIAHSVRKAFEMTPIHANSAARHTLWCVSQPASQPHSGFSTPPLLPLLLRSGDGAAAAALSSSSSSSLSLSMPVSRSGTPPITLPPLRKLPASSDADRRARDEGAGDECGGKVELPGFKEFEAAALAPSL